MTQRVSTRNSGNVAQTRLDLTVARPQFDRASFIVTEANHAALAIGEEFLKSPEPALAIVGPRGSGKSHLTQILAGAAGASVYGAADLANAEGDQAPVAAVDDADQCDDPRALLGLIESRRKKGGKLLLAGAGAPRSWAHGLRDLETRLEAMPRAALEEPDEDLLRAVIVQRFRARQWRTGAGVAAYAAPRLRRTFAAAHTFVEAAGAEAVASAKPINLALARKVIGDLSEAEFKA